MEGYSVFTIAKWFLHRHEMTPKKLEKIVYYAEAWSNTLMGHRLINDTEFEAWVHGPVSRELYNKYKNYGWNLIPKEQEDVDISEDVQELLESVWITYGDKNANELEALTHSEDPWKNARLGKKPFEPSDEVIDVESMKKYYSKIYVG